MVFATKIGMAVVGVITLCVCANSRDATTRRVLLIVTGLAAATGPIIVWLATPRREMFVSIALTVIVIAVMLLLRAFDRGPNLRIPTAIRPFMGVAAVALGVPIGMSAAGDAGATVLLLSMGLAWLVLTDGRGYMTSAR